MTISSQTQHKSDLREFLDNLPRSPCEIPPAFRLCTVCFRMNESVAGNCLVYRNAKKGEIAQKDAAKVRVHIELPHAFELKKEEERVPELPDSLSIEFTPGLAGKDLLQTLDEIIDEDEKRKEDEPMEVEAIEVDVLDEEPVDKPKVKVKVRPSDGAPVKKKVMIKVKRAEGVPVRKMKIKSKSMDGAPVKKKVKVKPAEGDPVRPKVKVKPAEGDPVRPKVKVRVPVDEAPKKDNVPAAPKLQEPVPKPPAIERIPMGPPKKKVVGSVPPLFDALGPLETKKKPKE